MRVALICFLVWRCRSGLGCLSVLGVGVFVWLEVLGVGCFLSFVGLFVLALAVVFWFPFGEGGIFLLQAWLCCSVFYLIYC